MVSNYRPAREDEKVAPLLRKKKGKNPMTTDRNTAELFGPSRTGTSEQKWREHAVKTLKLNASLNMFTKIDRTGTKALLAMIEDGYVPPVENDQDNVIQADSRFLQKAIAAQVEQVKTSMTQVLALLILIFGLQLLQVLAQIAGGLYQWIFV